jgi:hypothetical protein
MRARRSHRRTAEEKSGSLVTKGEKDIGVERACAGTSQSTHSTIENLRDSANSICNRGAANLRYTSPQHRDIPATNDIISIAIAPQYRAQQWHRDQTTWDFSRTTDASRLERQYQGLMGTTITWCNPSRSSTTDDTGYRAWSDVTSFGLRRRFLLYTTTFLIPRIYFTGCSSPANISQKRSLGKRKRERIIHNTNADHFNGVVFMCPRSPEHQKLPSAHFPSTVVVLIHRPYRRAQQQF